jgi:hypothetical protein
MADEQAQTTMSAAYGMTEEEAEKEDKLNSMYFTPESKMKHRMTFSDTPMDDKESPDGKCITGRVLKCKMPIFEGKKKTGAFEDKIIRQMVIDSLDGRLVRKIWRIKSKKMRELFRTPMEAKIVTNKVFVVEIRGELADINQYYVTAVEDKPAMAPVAKPA